MYESGMPSLAVGCLGNTVLGFGTFAPGRWQSGKDPPANVGDVSSIPGSGRFLWSRTWQPTPVFLPEKFYGQRKLEPLNDSK